MYTQLISNVNIFENQGEFFLYLSKWHVNLQACQAIVNIAELKMRKNKYFTTNGIYTQTHLNQFRDKNIFYQIHRSQKELSHYVK
jgi:hypothetical protein